MNENPTSSAIKIRPFIKGISLVELLVAMMLGLVLTGGLLQLSVSHKTGYSFQKSQTGNQENMRFAFYYLETLISRAGYMTEPQNSETAIFGPLSATSQCAAFVSGQVIANNLEGTGVCIRYQRADTTETDCQGNTIASASAFITRIFRNATTGQLMCGAQGATATVLVDGVEGLQLSYGISTNPDLLGKSIEAYVSTPTTASMWRDVVAVRLAVLGSRETSVQNFTPSYYFPLDSTGATTGSKQKAYYSSQKTITLRNAAL